jgi:hypothetical protein
MQWVELKRGGVNAPLIKQTLKVCADHIATNTAHKGHRCTKTRQTTRHIGGRSTQAVVHRLITRRITAEGTKAIDQGLSQTDHRIGISHQLPMPGPSN